MRRGLLVVLPELFIAFIVGFACVWLYPTARDYILESHWKVQGRLPVDEAQLRRRIVEIEAREGQLHQQQIREYEAARRFEGQATVAMSRPYEGQATVARPYDRRDVLIQTLPNYAPKLPNYEIVGLQQEKLTLHHRLEEIEARRKRATAELTRIGVDPCLTGNICTSVPVFFGTDRKRQDAGKRASFGPERAQRLQLGRAIVTVPRATQRKRGEIKRPTWFERVFLSVPTEGDPAKHFTILKSGTILFTNPNDFVAAVRQHMAEAGEFKDHVFVFVHGFWMTFDDGLYRTAQIAYDLGSDDEPFGTAFLYSWPSGGDLKDYAYDFDSARQAVQHLKSFLELVIKKTGAKNVHVIAHSMGNWPLLTVLDQMAKTSKGGVEINQIILAAPDIDVGEFSKLATTIAGVAKGVTLYASANDLAMKASREIHRDVPRAGDIPKEGPVIVQGVDTIDVSFVSTDALGAGHAEYADRKELLNDIGLILRKGERPPNARMPILERIPFKDAIYWRYPN